MVVDTLWDLSKVLRLRDDVQEQLSYELIRRVVSLILVHFVAGCAGISIFCLLGLYRVISGTDKEATNQITLLNTW